MFFKKINKTFSMSQALSLNIEITRVVTWVLALRRGGCKGRASDWRVKESMP